MRLFNFFNMLLFSRLLLLFAFMPSLTLCLLVRPFPQPAPLILTYVYVGMYLHIVNLLVPRHSNDIKYLVSSQIILHIDITTAAPHKST